MTFSQTAGYSVVPVLSRIVLCAAFFFVGYNKCFDDSVVYTPDEAKRLRELGVDVVPVSGGGSSAVTDVAWRQEIETGTLTGRRATPPPEAGGPETGETAPPPDEETGAAPPPEEGGPAESQEEQADPAEQPGDDAAAEPGTAKGMHRVTLMVDNAGWPADSPLSPKLLGVIAAVTEMVGGAMLLVGLFSRLWALGLAFTMGVAFYLTSFSAIAATPMPFDFVQNMGAFQSAALQLALFALAFGVLLTGAGGLSLDRLLFKRGGEADDLDSD